MKSNVILPAALLATAATAATLRRDVSNGASANLGIGTTCKSTNLVCVGWLPDDDDNVPISTINSILGKPNACFQGHFSHITSSTSYDGSDLTSKMADIVSSGAVLQAAIQPTGVTFAQVDANLAAQIAAVLQKFTDQGVQVWLRFAHEANWYVDNPVGAPLYPGGSTADFVQAWQRVADAVKGNSKVKMFWTMNDVGDVASALEPWWPGQDYVDVVGIDVYPTANVTFAQTYGNVYATYAQAYGKPFYIGETAAYDDMKKPWLQQLVDAGQDFPLYGGFSWFEYNKEHDYRIVTGASDEIAVQVLGY